MASRVTVLRVIPVASPAGLPLAAALRLLCTAGLLLPACFSSCSSESAGGAGAGRCTEFARVASDDVTVHRLGADGKPESLAADCGRLGCLRTAQDAVVVRQRDGSLWAAWDGRPGAVLGPVDATTPMSAPERWARAQVEPPAAPRSGTTPGPDPVRAIAEALPPELRTCGTTQAGGGLGIHIIQNKGDIWQRIEWVTPPQAPEVLALGPGAYPIADGSGALCAVATQVAPRAWHVRHVATNTTIEARPDHEHPPARCTGPAEVEVTTQEGSTIVQKDGTTVRLPPPQEASGEVAGAGVGGVPRALSVRLADGTTTSMSLRPDADLLGRPFPPGAVRARVSSVTDGGTALLVVERLMLPDCTGRDLLWHVVVAPNREPEVRPVMEGTAMIGRLSWALGAFWWTAAAPKLVDVSGNQ